MSRQAANASLAKGHLEALDSVAFHYVLALVPFVKTEQRVGWLWRRCVASNHRSKWT
jgi:hypothetical protein